MIFTASGSPANSDAPNMSHSMRSQSRSTLTSHGKGSSRAVRTFLAASHSLLLLGMSVGAAGMSAPWSGGSTTADADADADAEGASPAEADAEAAGSGGSDLAVIAAQSAPAVTRNTSER